MKNRIPIITTPRIVAGLLAVATFVCFGQNSPMPDPTHAAHVATGAMPPDVATGDPALSQQLSQLKDKVAQLESALAKLSPPMPATPSMGMGMDKVKSSAAMPGMSSDAAPAPAPAMAGMSAAAPAGGMMGMMDKMMPMAGGASMSGGSMPPAPAAGMSGGGMGMDKMEMAAMMGMGSGNMGAMSQSALPGFPGASHLYHIGATDFFLDHPQHISITTEQQAGLNKAKEQALLAKNTADRAIEQAEQELWMLTAADQPDAAKIQGKLGEIGKLTGDERFSFIRAVGDASKLLTDEQRKVLTGFAPPVSAAPVAAPMPGGMNGM